MDERIEAGGLVARAALLAAVAVLIAASSAHAATYTVNTAADGVDANPGDGVCATAAGQCTLRAAFMEANAPPGAGSDTVVFDPSLDGQEILLTVPGEGGAELGDLTLTGVGRTLNVVGRGWQNTIVRQTTQNRVFAVNPPAEHLSLRNLTVKGGDVPDAMFSKEGGGIRAIARLTLENALVTGNRTVGTGGGVYASTSTANSLTIRNSTVSRNTAQTAAGADVVGDGPDNVIENSRISGNEAQGVGGVQLSTSDGLTTLDQTAVTGNRSTGGGVGGVFSSRSGWQLISRSEISANEGGVGGIHTGGRLEVQNTTISANKATVGLSAGGIAVSSPTTGGGPITLTHVTVHDNSNDGGGPSSVFSQPDRTSEFSASILTGTCGAGGVTPTAVVSHGHNVMTDPTCIPAAAPGSDTNAAPMLGSLNHNGGGTRTHLLQLGSPAIGRVNPCLGVPFGEDQRTATRPSGAACDSGAYERTGSNPPAPAPPPPPADPPSNVTAPTISGTPSVGSTLTCSPGGWSPPDWLSFVYQWLLDGAPIAGATAPTRTVSATDQGSDLRCRVTASNAVGPGAAATSAAVSVPAAPPPDPGSPAPAPPPVGDAPTGHIAPPLQPAPGSVLREPAKLKVRRAGVVRGRLDVLARITRRADGDRVRVTYRSARRTTTFTAPVRNGTVRFARRLPARQARHGTGIMEIRYAGNDRVRPDDVRLRAATQRATLRRDGRPRINSQGRLSAAGTASRRARGVVRFRLEYVTASGELGVWRGRARISRGRWRLSAPLPAAARQGGYLSIQFTGYERARGGPMRGEQDAISVG